MRAILNIIFSALFLTATLHSSYALADNRSAIQQNEEVTAKNFKKEFRSISNPQQSVEYSVKNIQGMLNDLEESDRFSRASITREVAVDLVDRLSTAIDLYVLVLQDKDTPGEKRHEEIISRLEGKIYQSFISLLRHYGADPVDKKTRQIPQRSLFTKVVQEMMIDVKAFTTFSTDAAGRSVYSPIEKVYRDQATQEVLVKLQNFTKQMRQIDDGDKGDLIGVGQEIIQEHVVDPAIKTVNDRWQAQWITAGAYGALSIITFFVIFDYVGVVDGLLGGAGRTEVSQLVTGIINFSIFASMAILKAASIRGHVRDMVLNLQNLLKDPKASEIHPVKYSIATLLFRKKLNFSQSSAAQCMKIYR